MQLFHREAGIVPEKRLALICTTSSVPEWQRSFDMDPSRSLPARMSVVNFCSRAEETVIVPRKSLFCQSEELQVRLIQHSRRDGPVQSVVAQLHKS